MPGLWRHIISEGEERRMNCKQSLTFEKKVSHIFNKLRQEEMYILHQNKDLNQRHNGTSCMMNGLSNFYVTLQSCSRVQTLIIDISLPSGDLRGVKKAWRQFSSRLYIFRNSIIVGYNYSYVVARGYICDAVMMAKRKYHKQLCTYAIYFATLIYESD